MCVSVKSRKDEKKSDDVVVEMNERCVEMRARNIFKRVRRENTKLLSRTFVSLTDSSQAARYSLKASIG